jgi:hypothetical protein
MEKTRQAAYGMLFAVDDAFKIRQIPGPVYNAYGLAYDDNRVFERQIRAVTGDDAVCAAGAFLDQILPAFTSPKAKHDP